MKGIVVEDIIGLIFVILEWLGLEMIVCLIEFVVVWIMNVIGVLVVLVVGLWVVDRLKKVVIKWVECLFWFD